jgi:hypothetical protein
VFAWVTEIAGVFVLSGCVRLPLGETGLSVLPDRVPLLLGEIGRYCSWIVASPRWTVSANGETTLEEMSLLISNLENGERMRVQAPPGVASVGLEANTAQALLGNKAVNFGGAGGS